MEVVRRLSLPSNLNSVHGPGTPWQPSLSSAPNKSFVLASTMELLQYTLTSPSTEVGPKPVAPLITGLSPRRVISTLLH